MNDLEGHRERLRARFTKMPNSLSEIDRLELLLTYGIPRKDVAPIAQALFDRFGGIAAVLTAPADALLTVEGIGDATLTFLQVIRMVCQTQGDMTESTQQSTNQLSLFAADSKIKKTKAKSSAKKERGIRVFTNDEIANSLLFIPKAAEFKTLEEFKQFLYDNLPYNARETRLRRANNIIERFYLQGRLDTPLTYYASTCTPEQLKPALFYHVLKAEPIAARVAEELIYPALPIGRVDREQIRDFVLRYLPDVIASSQNKILRSIANTYALLSVGSEVGNNLHFHLHPGSLAGFLYILTCEYPQPGIYSYDSLYQCPVHTWLLWDREWIRRQLYNLRDMGILSRVSEIDSVKQFALAVDQPTALHLFFETIHSKEMALRDASGEDISNESGGAKDL